MYLNKCDIVAVLLIIALFQISVDFAGKIISSEGM